MQSIRHYRQIQHRCVYRPTGAATAGELAHMIADVLSHAREQRVLEAIVDITSMSGFDSPGPAFRRWAIGLWAHSVGREMRVAMIARYEHICPQKTGLLAAAEEGLNAGIFEDERQALAWLDAHRPAPSRKR